MVSKCHHILNLGYCRLLQLLHYKRELLDGEFCGPCVGHCPVVSHRRFEEVGHSGWYMSWEGRWNHLGVYHSRWSASCVHRQQASCCSQSTGMLESERKRHLDLHLTELGLWISYKMFGGAVDTERAGRCYSPLLASALRRTLGLPCSPFCPVRKWALTQG